ncbi:hypothetical protein COT70_02080 [candidate division WWE3 bacterium CG09_land_8_20_14_0_10_47_33]|uniref:Cytosolic protein n=1 Tax=candidate division WWE3 bacterium CG_4_9_14_0_2_um_filter_48_10 TaxID=1975078 RepID=A0A2M8EHQ6_UNCKA|nr:MAG: hypothetical protein COT70_02080 [candidate division WWE3 bacterium CG09_land_8_20_14_0_10_47_33]PIZ40521.1 MAG: hypothetical protein COY35_02105 [candidate division WWE3 bacterium CG_4_10_14_0_2_um_filter_47_8]PJC21721.1 MAG: hypothetical protein CO059_03270 [candidate division WWE3 bacterium CG_4_9_14_0_2_um_filter_48_10]PJE50875.1 MAG: hypothetical protein COV28_02785 [candidate division WWE3 bacterium CG10_big_fil_rev_8_21_14_0_10_48_23]
MECRQKENLKSCPCTWPDCPRKGICCLCIKHHWEKTELPACFFSKEAEKSFDRSLENFLKDQEILNADGNFNAQT